MSSWVNEWSAAVGKKEMRWAGSSPLCFIHCVSTYITVLHCDNIVRRTQCYTVRQTHCTVCELQVSELGSSGQDQGLKAASSLCLCHFHHPFSHHHLLHYHQSALQWYRDEQLVMGMGGLERAIKQIPNRRSIRLRHTLTPSRSAIHQSTIQIRYILYAQILCI